MLPDQAAAKQAGFAVGPSPNQRNRRLTTSCFIGAELHGRGHPTGKLSFSVDVNNVPQASVSLMANTQAKDRATRIRENKRRSPVRHKKYVEDLERRW